MKPKIAVLIVLLALAFEGRSQEADSLYAEEVNIRAESVPEPLRPAFQSVDSVAHTIRYDGDLAKTTYELTRNHMAEIDKVRAIFAWVTHNIGYDYKAYNKPEASNSFHCRGTGCKEKFAKWENDLIAKVLRRKKGVCSGYAHVFHRMCGYAGIRSSVVSGYTKRSPRAIGRMGSLNHAWNIVIIDNTPHYLDATWAAGYCEVGKKGKLTRFVRHYDDYYWLTPDEKMLRNHFPKDTIWPGTSKAQRIKYRDQPYVNEAFFRDLNVLSPESGVVRVQLCDTIRFRFEFHYAFRKLQVNTNLAKNPSIWTLEDGENVKNPRALKKQKYVDFRSVNSIHEFEYVVEDKRLRYIDVLVDHQRALRFAVDVTP